MRNEATRDPVLDCFGMRNEATPNFAQTVIRPVPSSSQMWIFLRTLRAFWYFQSSHCVFLAVVTDSAQTVIRPVPSSSRMWIFLRTLRAFWYFQSSHCVFLAVVTRFATSQFGRELSDKIPPASNFLFLVAVLKKIASSNKNWARAFWLYSSCKQFFCFWLQFSKKLRHEFKRAFWYNSFSRQFVFAVSNKNWARAFWLYSSCK